MTKNKEDKMQKTHKQRTQYKSYKIQNKKGDKNKVNE